MRFIVRRFLTLLAAVVVGALFGGLTTGVFMGGWVEGIILGGCGGALLGMLYDPGPPPTPFRPAGAGRIRETETISASR